MIGFVPLNIQLESANRLSKNKGYRSQSVKPDITQQINKFLKTNTDQYEFFDILKQKSEGIKNKFLKNSEYQDLKSYGNKMQV